jgi:hypothetical protein
MPSILGKRTCPWSYFGSTHTGSNKIMKISTRDVLTNWANTTSDRLDEESRALIHTVSDQQLVTVANFQTVGHLLHLDLINKLTLQLDTFYDNCVCVEQVKYSDIRSRFGESFCNNIANSPDSTWVVVAGCEAVAIAFPKRYTYTLTM